MKANIAFTLAAGAAAGALALIVAGCATPTIPVTMTVAGEVKLNGVSKIAIADFNSLPGDPFTGTLAADAETCALVRRAVASAFYVSPMYQVADLAAENDIRGENGAVPKKRFDAVVYGRLWWQVTPETEGSYPGKFTLESWANVPYVRKNPLTGKEEEAVARVTTVRKDVLQMLEYKSRNATLMLTLSIYRLTGNGEIEKITDTYQVADNGFTLMNGELKSDAAIVGTDEDGAVARLQAAGKSGSDATAFEEMFAPKSASLAGAALSAGLASGLGAGLGGAADAAPAAADGKPGRKVDANGKIVLTQETVAMPSELQAKLILATTVTRNLGAKLANSMGFSVALLEDNENYEDMKATDPVLVGVSYNVNGDTKGFAVTPDFLRTVQQNKPDAIALCYRIDGLSFNPATGTIRVTVALSLKNLATNKTVALGSRDFRQVTKNRKPDEVMQDFGTCVERAITALMNGEGMAAKLGHSIKSLRAAAARPKGPMKLVINCANVDKKIKTRVRVGLKKALVANGVTDNTKIVKDSLSCVVKPGEEIGDLDDLWGKVSEIIMEVLGDDIDVDDDWAKKSGDTLTVTIGK